MRDRWVYVVTPYYVMQGPKPEVTSSMSEALDDYIFCRKMQRRAGNPERVTLKVVRDA